MISLRHSKYKNTGLLFELLAMRITSDTLEGNNSKALQILKKYYKQGTLLAEELVLYKALVKEPISSPENAYRLVEGVLNKRHHIDSKALSREKFKLNRQILERYGKKFYTSRIPNYREYASICNLFEYKEDENPVEYARNRQTLLEHITASRKEKIHQSRKTLYERNTQELTYRILLNNFNKKYDTLDKSQKNILRTYIYTVSDGPALKEFADKEATNIIKLLTNTKARVESDITRVKIDESINLLKTQQEKPLVSDAYITSLLHYRELIKELKKDKA